MNKRFEFGSPLFSISIYTILIALLYREFIFSDKMLFGTDTIQAGVMFETFLKNYFNRYLTYPLWDPYLFGGLPFVDAMHGDSFFPLSMLRFVMPVYRALGWKLVLASLAGGIIVYYYFRNRRFSYRISFLGGLFYLLNSFTISLVYAGHGGRMFVSVLFPLLMLAIDKIFDRTNWRSLLLWAIGFSLLILANHPQLAYFAMWGVGLYTLYRMFFLLKEKGNVRRAAVISVIIIAGIIIGFAGSLVQILPQYVYVNKYSPRAEGGRGYEYAASWSLHYEELVSLVFPGFVGASVGEKDTYWGRNAFRLNSEYPGIIVTLLALFALIYYRKRDIYFFLGLAVLAVLYALGDHTPLFKLFYYVVPGVKSFRAPSTIMFLYDFSLVVMAVYALKYITESDLKSKDRDKIQKYFLIVAGVVGAIALLFTIAPRALFSLYSSIFYPSIPDVKSMSHDYLGGALAAETWVSALMIGLIALFWRLYLKKSVTVTVLCVIIGTVATIDLWREDAKFISTVSYDRFFRQDPVSRFLVKQDEDFRVFVLPGTYHNLNFLALYGTEQLFGYHGNQLKRFDEFTNREWLQSARTQQEFQQRYSRFLNSRKLDLLNVKYLAATFPIDNERFKTVMNYGKIYLIENRDVLPRARVVYEYEVIGDYKAAFRRIESGDFDYRNSVVLGTQPGIPIKPDSLTYTAVKIADDRINDYRLMVDIDRPGILVLAENFYPAWKAKVNGTERKIILADGDLMAVPLEAGKNDVRIEFDSPYYNYSSLSTEITWIIFIVLIIYSAIIELRRKGKKE
jgi:hypothetical protein